MFKLSTIVAATLALATLANSAAIAAAKRTPPGTPEERAARVERMRECGAEWKLAKADDAIKAAGWPKYWSACNTRKRAAAQ